MANLINVEVPELPEGYVPLEVVAVVKCLDTQGEPTMCVRVSDGLMAWEAIGLLTAATDMARSDLQTDLQQPWTDDEGEGDPD